MLRSSTLSLSLFIYPLSIFLCIVINYFQGFRARLFRSRGGSYSFILQNISSNKHSNETSYRKEFPGVKTLSHGSLCRLPTTKLHTPSFFYKKEQKCHLISFNSVNIWYSSLSKPSMVVYLMPRIHF